MGTIVYYIISSSKILASIDDCNVPSAHYRLSLWLWFALDYPACLSKWLWYIENLQQLGATVCHHWTSLGQKYSVKNIKQSTNSNTNRCELYSFFVSLSDDLKTKMTIRVQIIAITFRRVVSSSELSNDTTPSLVF